MKNLSLVNKKPPLSLSHQAVRPLSVSQTNQSLGFAKPLRPVTYSTSSIKSLPSPKTVRPLSVSQTNQSLGFAKSQQSPSYSNFKAKSTPSNSAIASWRTNVTASSQVSKPFLSPQQEKAVKNTGSLYKGIAAPDTIRVVGQQTKNVKDWAQGRVTVYRVESSASPLKWHQSNGNARIQIEKNGQVSIPSETKPFYKGTKSGQAIFQSKRLDQKALGLNFGKPDRAVQFFEKRMKQFEGGLNQNPKFKPPVIKSFQVERSVLKDLRNTAVTEQKSRLFPDRPLKVDFKETPNLQPVRDVLKQKHGLQIPQNVVNKVHGARLENDQFMLRPKQINSLSTKIVQGTGKIEVPDISTGAKATKILGKVARPLAVVTDGISLANAYQADGGKIGKNTAVTTGGIAGGWGGAAAGAVAGATIGSVVPIVGTAAGGIIGGVIGGFAGSTAGESLIKWAWR